MLKLIYITLFPSYFNEYFKISLARKSIKEKKVNFQTYNIRDYSYSRKADDYPYGGKKGMLIKIDSLVKSLANAEEKNGKLYIILLSPQGKKFQQKDVERLIEKKNLTFICGHYEGFDQRIENYVDEMISIGDFITMGGELPALAISESLIRAIPEFIKTNSYKNETFSDLKFDYDSYTRPSSFDDLEVPEVLKNGNHKKIEEWRTNNSNEKEINKNKIISQELRLKKKLPNLNKWRIIKK